MDEMEQRESDLLAKVKKYHDLVEHLEMEKNVVKAKISEKSHISKLKINGRSIKRRLPTEISTKSTKKTWTKT